MVVEVSGLGEGSHALCRNLGKIAREFISHFKPDTFSAKEELFNIVNNIPKFPLTEEQIDEYRSWPIERRLQWLLLGNRLRKMLPAKTIEIQEAFRQGKM